MNIPDRNHSRKREQNPTRIQHWMKLMTLLSRATTQDMMEPNGVPVESKVIAGRPRYARLAKTPTACEINNIAFCRVHMRSRITLRHLSIPRAVFWNSHSPLLLASNSCRATPQKPAPPIRISSGSRKTPTRISQSSNSQSRIRQTKVVGILGE